MKAILGLVGLAALALFAMGGGSSPPSPSPSPSPTPPAPTPPTAWRAMLDGELIPSEVQYAVMMQQTPSYGSTQTHLTPAGWRQWRRQSSNVTVWRPASDPVNGGSNQDVEPLI